MDQSPEIVGALSILKTQMEEELDYMRSLMAMMGTMETLFSVAECSLHSTGQNISTTNSDSHSITQKETHKQLNISSVNDTADNS